MECEACVGHVKQGLGSVPGVTRADVDLISEQAQVTFDSDQSTVADMLNAVEEEGYAAELI